MDPLLPEEGRHPVLLDLSSELISKSCGLAARLHPVVAESIGQLVRSMNCYYSNLIEGHNTHPRDIDRALVGDFSKAHKKRALQLEAKAHIDLQCKIDEGKIHFTLDSNFLCALHREFCSQLPEELLWVENSGTQIRLLVEPGRFRQSWVQIGQHIPPGPEEIPAFMHRFEQAYSLKHSHKIQRIIAVAASHHRLLWIHPFLDGNGRVARLFSHAFLQYLGIGSTLWSLSRGLARRVNSYKAHLMEADLPRQGDLDGRGNLSAKGLVSFCAFFLETCLDQVIYMDSLIEPITLSRRIERYVVEEIDADRLPKGSFLLLREALLQGQIERGKAAAITGYQERQARTILNKLIGAGLLISKTPKGPVTLGFPLDVLESWFPRLYPEM
ncbi:MAG: Fic family protein [Gammaproteobacteria bacterium]|nr:Fic family protein [Gammaproteobacteria bacterium]